MLVIEYRDKGEDMDEGKDIFEVAGEVESKCASEWAGLEGHWG